MNDKLTELIKYGSESATLDFKKTEYSMERHEKKNEILKDISAMANHPADEDKFIIIGIKGKNGVAGTFTNVDDVTDEAKYQQFVNGNIEPPITFEYKSFLHEGIRLAFFRIFNNTNRPYLFKKDAINPVSQNIDYRTGDGYIRQGTSTKKITRNDLELIYKSRLSGKDRKADIKVTAFICESDNEEIRRYDVSCFDVAIENQSSKSIDLDIEIRFIKSNTFTIIEKPQLLKELDEKRNRIRQNVYPFIQAVPNVHISFDVALEDTGTHQVATRTKRRGERTAISIAQHDGERYAFCRELIILANPPALIKGEVILRSDDFIEGIQKIPFSIEHHQEGFL